MIAESTGDTKTAVAEYRAALKIAWSVARQHPKDTKILMQPGMIEHSLGLLGVKTNDPTAKIMCVKKSACMKPPPRWSLRIPYSPWDWRARMPIWRGS